MRTMIRYGVILVAAGAFTPAWGTGMTKHEPTPPASSEAKRDGERDDPPPLGGSSARSGSACTKEGRSRTKCWRRRPEGRSVKRKAGDFATTSKTSRRSSPTTSQRDRRKRVAHVGRFCHRKGHRATSATERGRWCTAIWT